MVNMDMGSGEDLLVMVMLNIKEFVRKVSRVMVIDHR